MLFIVGGAFVGIEDTIQRRIKRTQYRFNSKLIDEELRNEVLKYLRPDDLIKYGLIPELVGRLSNYNINKFIVDEMIKV